MTTATPDRAAFAAAYADGTAQLVWTELIADLETPVAAYLKLSGGEISAFFWSLLKTAIFAGAIR